MAVWQYLASTGYNKQRQASFDHGIFNGISKVSHEKSSFNQFDRRAVYY